MRFHRLLFSVSVGLLCAGAESTSAGTWRSDYKAAVADARTQRKPVLVHFYSDSCLPCMIMERRVLNQDSTLKLLGEKYIAVKLKGNFHPNLLRKFSVQVYPFDAIVDPDGNLVLSSRGGLSLQAYLGLLTQAERRFQKTWIAKNPAPVPKIAKADPKPDIKDNNSSNAPADAKKKLLGLAGYSPIALARSREWVEGDPKLTAEHKGITFRFANAKELSEFTRHPEWYAPRLLGCDPVTLHVREKAVAGSVQYGAFFDGELYLFSSNENRQLFKKEPYRYVRTRHVLRDDIIGGTRLR